MRKMSVEELLERYAVGQRDFRGMDIYFTERFGELEGINLNGVDLGFARIRDFRATEIDLTGAYLRGLYWPESELEGANLSGTDLSYAKIWDANLIHANLNRANLTGADLQGAQLVATNLSRANFRAACLNETDLAGANLTETNFIYAKGVSFDNVIFKNTIMPDGTIRNS